MNRDGETQQHIIERDTRNQPTITPPTPPDTELCKRHRQRHERLHVIKKGADGSRVSRTVVTVVT